MTKQSKTSATIIIIVLCVGAVVAINLFKGNPAPDPARSAAARARGNPGAAIKIVEFVDFQCGHCAHGARMIKDLLLQHPNTMKVEVRYFPLAGHKHGYSASRYAECAAQQGKFWEYQDLLFERQGQWSVLNDAAPAFEEMAKDVKLNSSRLKACLEDKRVDDIIQANRKEGETLNVKSTPTYFINDKIAVGTGLLTQELQYLLRNGF